MKQFFLLIVFSITSFYAQAQLAIIQDEDGYVNLRYEPDSSGSVIMRLIQSDVFFCFELERDWYGVDVYVKDERQLVSGYIHKSNVKFIHTYDSFSVIQVSSEGKIVFKDKTTEVDVKIKPFDPKANTIEYAVDNVGHRYVATINHKNFWGTDGGIPNVTYEHIKVSINGNKIAIPSTAYENLFQPNFQFMKVNHDIQNDVLYIHGLNSDGAGAYVFVIIIKNKVYDGTVVMIPF